MPRKKTEDQVITTQMPYTGTLENPEAGVTAGWMPECAGDTLAHSDGEAASYSGEEESEDIRPDASVGEVAETDALEVNSDTRTTLDSGSWLLADNRPDTPAEETAALFDAHDLDSGTWPAIGSDTGPPADRTPQAEPEPRPDQVSESSAEGDDENPEPPYPAVSPEDAPAPARAKPKAKAPRKKTILDLKLNDLDRDLPEEERREWSAIYASYRAKSVLSGVAVGADQNSFEVFNRATGENEKKTLGSLIVIDYRVKVLIPESELWMPGEERPAHVLRNMVGSKLDYIILEIDREGGCAVASRRMALAAKRHFFSTVRGGHKEGELLKCRVMAVGAKRCTVECAGYDIPLSQRDLSYSSILDLREKYHPGQELSCKLKEYDKDAGRLVISVKDAKSNPFVGADIRHPPGSRRQAVISGKYAGGVFCTLPDDTVCLCLYSARHSDANFSPGDSVIIVIRQYDYDRQLIFGRILTKW